MYRIVKTPEIDGNVRISLKAMIMGDEKQYSSSLFFRLRSKYSVDLKRARENE
jgi:hypothetical protein